SRAYDPKLAHWLTRDPFANAERILEPNLYVYVRNNPINAVDPNGTQSEPPPNYPPPPDTMPAGPYAPGAPGPFAPTYPAPPLNPAPDKPGPLDLTNPKIPGPPRIPSFPDPRFPDVPIEIKVLVICGVVFVLFPYVGGPLLAR